MTISSMQGKRVLATGATSGIGLATARELACQGAVVLVVSRNAARCAQTVASIQQLAIYLGHAWSVNALAWSPDGSCVASGSDDGQVHVWAVG